MKEFGSNFQSIDSYDSHRAHLTDVFKGALLLADGRQCIIVLIKQFGWKRLWMPEYFSKKVVKSIIDQTGIAINYYEDNPFKEAKVNSLPYQDGDVLLRMNYFGMRELRKNKNIPVPVIEDHSHDPFGHWALYSDADWCISSIRKTLPLPEGGMMWSPKGHKLEVDLMNTDENQIVASQRWKGMEEKANYLDGMDISKRDYREIFLETEEWFENAAPSLIDERSKTFIEKQLDINLWLGAKRKNWYILKDLIRSSKCSVLEAEHESCTMFSLVLLFNDKSIRNSVRQELIQKDVYPAVLWDITEEASEDAKSFSSRMLSIHCDGRYSEQEIRMLARIINEVLDNY